MIFIHTEWSDILTFTYGYDAYLLQGRKNKFTKATSFRVVKPQWFIGLASPESLKKEDLEKANLWHTIEKESEGEA